MKVVILLIIVVIMFLSLGIWLEMYENNNVLGKGNMNYGISMSTDKMSYSVGELIMVTLKIFNYTEEDIAFHFNTSQRYDFIIEDEEGNKIWRWSQDRMFAQMLGKESLGQHNPEVIYTAKYRDKLSPGYYKVTGVFVVTDRPMSGNVIIMVK